MIKLRMYIQKDFELAMMLFYPKVDEEELKNRSVSARDFEELLIWASYEGEGKPPFRDKESMELLKSHGLAYDWKKDMEGIIRHIESSYKDKSYRIIGHATTLPTEVLFRKVPCLIVDKNTDGTYVIGEALSVKYPSLDEILSGVMPEYGSDRERCVLVVECNERLEKQEDIAHAVYGFRILQDQIELFEKHEAVLAFGRSLKEACASGRYTVVEGNGYR